MKDSQRVIVEALLVVRCQAGDDAAFEKLYDSYSDRLIYYLRRLVGAAGLAEDAAQAVWLTVYRKLKTLDEPRAFRTWLYRVAHNEAISALRKSSREVPLETGGVEDDLPGDEHPDDIEQFDALDVAAVHAGLERVSGPHREVLTLRFLHEMSYEEIATITQVAIGTVRSRLHHAKRALRRELEPPTSSASKGQRR